ncbi:acyl-CoA thioesterase [Kribbella solani]|uniref:Acyl-CoA thioester hydrolase n=1 Tax=Kribbella solani TaxID=236067 RepID=A0A841DJY1_9ACTN|nr:acyl-CoA thioesterase [Kribbella solani]MBB5977385.1 acyl-CoA thioester hydrolase [Kribbella solani]MDX2969747.1 acyl-CoA thioesterase [Kribbella solani]MDX3001702.1 acyl-CoA thioesterase [Kribbella solani]
MPRWVETAPRIVSWGYVETAVQVRWSECDLQRHAYYGNYMVWCDLGREAFALAVGVNYLDYQFTTTEFRIRFHTPAYYRDELLVRTWSSTPQARLDCHYEIYRKAGRQLIAEATSRHALVDSEKGLRVKGPSEFHDIFEAFLESKRPRQPERA